VDPLNVAIIDPAPALRIGLGALLRERGFVVVAATSDVDELLSRWAHVDIHLVISDVTTATRGALKIVEDVRAAQPNSKILFFGGVNNPALISALLSAGANGFALKTQPAEDVVNAIGRVLDGNRYLPPFVSEGDIETARRKQLFQRLLQLSKRQHEVLDHTVRGRSNAEIAQLLFISPRTAESHRQQIVRKLRTSSLMEMVSLGILVR
jgi:DNA-binding NarL/FixJ family response regulator